MIAPAFGLVRRGRAAGDGSGAWRRLKLTRSRRQPLPPARHGSTHERLDHALYPALRVRVALPCVRRPAREKATEVGERNRVELTPFTLDGVRRHGCVARGQRGGKVGKIAI